MFRLQFLIVVILFSIYSGDTPAEENVDGEYSIKADFLYNFTKFVRWPEGSAPKYNQDGLRLCLVGDNPFGDILKHLAEKVSAKGKKMMVKYFPFSATMTACHILFVSSSERSRLARILDSLKNSPVLIVGDTPGFGEMGVGINFYTQDNKVRFKVNKEAVDRSGLRLSSELLNLDESGEDSK